MFKMFSNNCLVYPTTFKLTMYNCDNHINYHFHQYQRAQTRPWILAERTVLFWSFPAPAQP